MRTTRDWTLARRAARFKPSVFVDFDALPEHPDPVHLGGGAPPDEYSPQQRMAWALSQVWTEADPSVLHYAETEGHEPLRAFIAERMALRNVRTDVDEILITSGSQQGLDLVARALIDPGDRVILEAPGYFGAFQVFDHFEPEYSLVPVDEHGIIPEALAELLANGPRPKLIYTVSTFQNPTGGTLSQERRQTIIDLATRAGVPIVEDDPYGDLWYYEQPTPLRAQDPNVIYLGSFSKTLAPALRMGWMVAPSDFIKMLIDVKEAADIQSGRMMQRGVVRACGDGWFDAHLDEARANYRRRCERVLGWLEEWMPEGVHWTRPEGGFFIWVTLPENADTLELLPAAAEAGVTYIPGSAFYPDYRPSPSLRIGYTTIAEERIALGIERLGTFLRGRLT